MANSKLPVTPDAGGRLNAHVLNLLRSSKFHDALTPKLIWQQRIKIVNGAIGQVALAAAVNQDIDLHVAFPKNLFPQNVLRGWAGWWRITDFSGGAVATCTGEVGDAGDTNGLILASNIFTGAGQGLRQTATAAEQPKQGEQAFVPVFRLVTTVGNVDALTAGELHLMIKYDALPGQPSAS